MGKDKQKNQSTQGSNRPPIGEANRPLPPQTPEMLAGAKLLGQPVRAHVDGRIQTIWLTEFDGIDSYWGFAVRNNPAEGSDTMPKFTPVPGLRAYPYSARPAYAFQFVRPGEDESVLVNIAAANLPRRSDE